MTAIVNFILDIILSTSSIRNKNERWPAALKLHPHQQAIIMFPFPKVSIDVYLALNSLHVDERSRSNSILQVRRACCGFQHRPAYYTLLGCCKVLLISVHHFLSLLLLLLPISLVLSYGCDNVGNTASGYLFFSSSSVITAHITEYKSRPGPLDALGNFWVKRERDISETNRAGRRVIPSPMQWALSAYRQVRTRVCCAVYTHDGLREELSCLYSPG